MITISRVEMPVLFSFEAWTETTISPMIKTTDSIIVRTTYDSIQAGFFYKTK